MNTDKTRFSSRIQAFLRRSHSSSFLLIASLLALGAAAWSQKPKPNAPTAKQATQATQERKELKEELLDVKDGIQEATEKVNQADAQAGAIAEDLGMLDARIQKAQEELNKTNLRLALIEDQQDILRKRMTETEERLIVQRALLGQRVRENYERGQTTYTQVLIESRSLHDLMSRSHYVRQIVLSDTLLIDSVRNDMRRMEEDQKALETQQRDQETLATEFERQKDQLVADRKQREAMLVRAEEERATAENEMEELQEEAEAMTSRIQQLSNLLQRRRDAMKRARAAMRRRSKQVFKEDETSIAWNGVFIRPVDGRITSNFGYRFHPILARRKMHTGVDIGSPTGTPIRAAAAGTVILSSYNRGYGNCVIIDHGDGYTTLYGHCSQLLAPEGKTVAQGEVIALVGSTGMSTGPHLHWEVRRDGVPIQPPY